jgi:hypothetical protein
MSSLANHLSLALLYPLSLPFLLSLPSPPLRGCCTPSCSSSSVINYCKTHSNFNQSAKSRAIELIAACPQSTGGHVRDCSCAYSACNRDSRTLIPELKLERVLTGSDEFCEPVSPATKKSQPCNSPDLLHTLSYTIFMGHSCCVVVDGRVLVACHSSSLSRVHRIASPRQSPASVVVARLACRRRRLWRSFASVRLDRLADVG